MRIAQHAIVSNSAHVQNLPSSMTTLYELTRLPEDVVVAKIKDGTITPKLERKQVGEIRTMEANANRGSYLRPPECPPTTEANTAHVRYLRPPDARRFSSNYRSKSIVMRITGRRSITAGI